MLQFSHGNSKLRKTAKALRVKMRDVYSFNLLAGHDCPYAKECKSQVNLTPRGRVLVDGPNCRFRCYGASIENRLPHVRDIHEANSKGVRSALRQGGVELLIKRLDAALPPEAGLVRIHSDAGDFFNRHYFLAWMGVAALNHRKGCRFYFYTKALPFVGAYAATQPGADLSNGILTPNVRVTGSRGGTHDHLLESLNLREAEVVFSEGEATREIDRDDTHAARSGGSFNLLIHATQPAGTPAMEAWEVLRRATVVENRKAKLANTGA